MTDSDQMNAKELLAETLEFNERLREQMAKVEPAYKVGAVEARRIRRGGRSWAAPPVLLPEGRNETVPGRSGPITVRVFTPVDVQGVYLHLHGGGWTIGGSDEQDPALWELAQRASVAVVSVEYRLAPEHPYPAAPDDCEDVARWLLDQSAVRFDTDRLTIGGASAGANLAAVTLLRLRDQARQTSSSDSAATGFRAANLEFGVYDLAMTPSQRLWGDRELILSTPLMHFFYRSYVPEEDPEVRRHPDISPLYADLSGMPPARFTVGTGDPLLDDTLFMEARWRATGVPTVLEVVPEAPHGFSYFPITVSERSRRAAAAFIGEAVAN
jgi:acetyl esterase/lipase